MRRSRNIALCMLLAVIGATAGCSPPLPSTDGAGATITRGEPPSPRSHALTDLVRSCEPEAAAGPTPASDVRDCYTRRLSEVLQAKGATAGMLTLYQLAEASPRFASRCHETAHRVSELMYASVGNIPDAMGLCKTGCAYACPHAVIRSYLRSLPQETPPDVRQLCPSQTLEGLSINQWHCTHGVGHGLAHYFPDFRQALSTCRQFALYWEHRRCVQGVFMEFTRMTADAHAPTTHAPPTLSICQTVKPDEHFDCYNLLIKLVGLEAGNPVPSRLSACNAIPPEHRGGCYFGIGRLLTGAYIERETEVIPVCRSGETTYATECMLGFASVLANVTNPGRGLDFCRKLHLDARMRCTESMGRAIRILWSDQDRVTIECAKAGEPPYVRACRDVELTPDGLRSDIR